MEKEYSVKHTVQRTEIVSQISTFFKYRNVGVFLDDEILDPDLTARTKPEQWFTKKIESLLTDTVCQNYTKRDYDLHMEAAAFDSGQVSTVDSIRDEMVEQNVYTTIFEMNLVTKEAYEREHATIQKRIDGEDLELEDEEDYDLEDEEDYDLEDDM